MDEFKRIIILDNEIEAQRMDSILTVQNIPRRLKPYQDSDYDGIFQAYKGRDI
jgi:hypothetical protein